MQLEQLVTSTNPDRIYAHFHVPESMYFDGLPSREQFGWYYSFLKKRGTFDVAKNGEELAKHKVMEKRFGIISCQRCFLNWDLLR